MIRVVAAVIVHEGRVLVCQRCRRDRFPLKWEFPGGKVEPGESPQEALARELREELGVEAVIGRELHRTRHSYFGAPETIEIHFYAASLNGRKPSNLVFERIEWTAPGALPQYDFLEANHEIVQRLASGALLLNC